MEFIMPELNIQLRKHTVYNFQAKTHFRKKIEFLGDALYPLGKFNNRLLSITFVEAETIKQLNSDYRHKNSATDVLTFVLDDSDLLGDVFICPSIVKANAKEHSLTYQNELITVMIHAFAHLMGYDHEKDSDYILMKKAEAKLYRHVYLKKERKP